MSSFVEFLEENRLPHPKLHVVLGSGFGSPLDELQRNGLSWKHVATLPFADVPGLAASTVEGHSGEFRVFTQGPTAITMQVGRIHGYEGHSAQAVVRPVLEGIQAGTKNFILTNAAGGLTLNFSVGSAVVLRDHINLTGQNPLTGPNRSGPRFPDMTSAYDRELSHALRRFVQEEDLEVHEGVYVGVCGPSFETPAEVRTYALLGGHVVGMSTVWETIALRQAGARVAGISMVSNSGAGLTHATLTHQEVLESGKVSALSILKGIFKLAFHI